jgi:tRNA (guanine37-N1)-methyltransferase
VLNDENSIIEESHSDGLLEYPQYTRPEVFEGLSVPKVLLSGNHKDIDDWKKKEALEKTKLVRPDLLKAKPG